MTKRIVAALLWFYTGWYLGAEIAYGLSLDPALGPVMGMAAAAVLVYNPGGVLWRSTRARQQSSAVHAGAASAPEV